MLIRSYMSVATLALAFTMASAASAVEITNGLSTNGLSTNGLSTNGLSTNGLSTNGLSTNGLNATGTASSVAQLEAAILQDGSVILLAQ